MDRPRPRGRHVTRARITRVLAIPAVLAWCLLLLLPGVAGAHAGVVTTDPGDGARLPTAPGTVSVTFNGPVSLAADGLRLIRADGSLADIGSEDVRGVIVTQPIEPLADGWYVMAWSIVSEDGHVVHGSVTFAVGDADLAARPMPSATPSMLETVLWATRGIADLAILVGVGALFAWVMLGARTGRVARLRDGALLVATSFAAVWLAVEVSDAGTGWLGTPYALSGIARLALLIGASVLAAAGPSRERVALACGVLALATLAVGGHATGSPLTSLTLAIHLLAGVTWLGAAPAVALVLWDRTLPDEPDALGVVRSFSRAATLTLALVFGGGVASALLLTNGLEGGPTIYVWIVLAKLGVVGLAAGMGALGRRALTRDGGRSRYRRLFLLDGALLIVVAALSSALTLVGPHQGHAGHDGHEVGSPRCAMAMGPLGVAFVADPGTPGTNTVTVSGPPASSRGVSVSIAHPFAGGASTDVQLVETDGVWIGQAALSFTGDWTATVSVRVDSFTEQQASCTFQVRP
ncbi:MAG: copper resistance protein CopC/CopD [Chloroflexi bacterium]|nr:copper resistance protein CopC/CopD [Chloroflexota bacterium]